MQSNSRQACSPVLSHGVLGALSLVSLVFLEVVHIVRDRVLLETCAEEVACLHPQRPGGAGIARSMSTRRGQQLVLVQYKLT